MTERGTNKFSTGVEEPPSKKRQRDMIGKELRRLFDDVASEPVPDDLLALLDQLEAKLDGPGLDEPILDEPILDEPRLGGR